ncbi:fimbrial protein [Dyella subtropica]|uniref:fimbrial protein n=1 Tax=Dyella subtropica TaxID=2992127 RepID=UPI0022563B0C|nr:fimbrial protein [Dyella subtropica]
MTKTLVTTALIAALGFAALAPNSASAADGTITVTGTINSSTCKINGANSPASIAVTLPTVSTNALNAVAATAGRTPFSIALTGCGALTKAQTFFEPGPTILADGNLKNNGGSATGVEVQLLDSSFTAINLFTNSASQPQFALTSGAGTVNYYAQYYATAAAGAGNVTTSVQFTMLYQ